MKNRGLTEREIGRLLGVSNGHMKRHGLGNPELYILHYVKDFDDKTLDFTAVTVRTKR